MATRLIQTALGPRMAVIEEKLDRLVAANFTGGASAPPSPPVTEANAVSAEDIEFLAESLAEPDAPSRLPSATIITITPTERGPRATGVTLPPLPYMTLEAALASKVLDWRGRLNRVRYEAAISALADRTDSLRAVALPTDPGATPDHPPAKVELRMTDLLHGDPEVVWLDDWATPRRRMRGWAARNLSAALA
jgi:hypothetical protein